VELQIPSQLLANARELRKNQTNAEELLWQLLRGKKLNNLKFRRQHPLKAGFIIDFYCAELKLGIEIDGGYHNIAEQQERDVERVKIINEYGINIIRFSNEKVLNHTFDVLNEIVQATQIPPLQIGEGQGVRKFSAEATDVFDAGRELWRYYHAAISSPHGGGREEAVNASLYDIREYFQGRNEKGKMNNASNDEKYNELIDNLRIALKILAKKIEPKVYEYEFLKR
jgi:very-short-patch-repair endonuclease